MEKDEPKKQEEIPDDVLEFLEWVNMANITDVSTFINEVKESGICMKRAKLTSMDPVNWKKEVSEDPTTLKYREPETGLYYETMDIIEYIQDCRQRKRALSTEDILDFEMIHKDRPQKLFFWVHKRFEDDLDTFSNALKSFLLKEFGQDTEISIDEFGNRFIIVCQNIMVDNYEQKMIVLKRFGSAYQTDEIGGYLLHPIETYEEIPSIANVAYKNPVVNALIENGYRPTARIMEKIRPLLVNVPAGGLTVNITNITVNINNNYGSKSAYKKFIDHIIENLPTWYIPNTWIMKKTLVDEFNKFNDSEISAAVVIKNLKSEGLFELISAGEKRARLNPGENKVNLFLTKRML